MEYIERKACLEAAKKSHLYFDIKPIINTIPAADVRNVVMCKDCKYWELSKIAPTFHLCTYVCGATFVREAEDFCSRGLKMEV